MANSDWADLLDGPDSLLLLRFLEPGDDLETALPPFDASAGAARLHD